jgi:hypothetical protein
MLFLTEAPVSDGALVALRAALGVDNWMPWVGGPSDLLVMHAARACCRSRIPNQKTASG